MASTSADPLGSAIASVGVPDEPSSAHSAPTHHVTPLDGIDDGSVQLKEGDTKESDWHSHSIDDDRDHKTSNGKAKAIRDDEYDDDDEENDLVMFSAGDVLPNTHVSPGRAQSRQSADESRRSPRRHSRSGSDSSVKLAQSPSAAMTALGRASLESIGFSYRDHLLPLSLSAEVDDEGDDDGGHHDAEDGIDTSSRKGLGRQRRHQRTPSGGMRRDERRVGLIDGIALTVGLQIGSGIFSSPGIVTLNTGSIGASIVVWLVSGALAWTGASSYAELGAAIPLNGGAQAYLNYSFGPLSGYLFSWSAITCLKPSSAAIMATIFGEYLARIIFHTTGAASSDPHEQGLEGIPSWSIKLIAILAITSITLLNALSAKLGTRTQIFITLLKLGALIVVPILATVHTARGLMPADSRTAFKSIENVFSGSSTSPSSYALALYSGLWAFDGWDQSSYVAGEMKNAGRDLPRVIHISLGVVVVIFTTSVVSYFTVLSPSAVAQTNTVALDFGSAIIGKTGGVIFALIVAISCFGAINGHIYTTSRFVYAAGREGHLPALFGRIHRRTRTPLAALTLNFALISLFIIFGSGFASLVNFYGVCSWTFYLVTVLGLLYLRIKEPNLTRPYQTWLATPIAFSAVALFLLFMPIFSAPWEALAAFAFISMGVPMYYATQASGQSSLSSIPGFDKLIALIRRMTGMTGAQDAGRGGDGAALFGKRRVRRIGKVRAGAGNSSSLGTTLDSLHEEEEEEEGDEEEAVEMLPRQ